MQAGRWTSSTIGSPTASASVFSTKVDDATKQCLGAIQETSISGQRVARELNGHHRTTR